MGFRYSKYTSVKEVEIENYLVARIKSIGGRCIKFDPRNSRGLPDRICFIPGGLIVLVELKRPYAKPRKNQRHQLAMFRKLGFQATWADTKKKVDSIMEWIKKHRATTKWIPFKKVCIRGDCPLRRNEVFEK